MENDESSTKDADPENKVTKMKTFFNVNKKTNTKYVFFLQKILLEPYEYIRKIAQHESVSVIFVVHFD